MADEDHIELLIGRLSSGVEGDPDAEWEAAIALGRIREGGARGAAIAALRQVLGNGRAHALTRAHAVEALGNLGAGEAGSTLLAALDDSYGLVRAYAARALGLLRDSHATGSLLTCLRDDEFFGARAEAAIALALIAAPQAPAERTEMVGTLEQMRDNERAREGSGSSRVVAEIDRGIALLHAGGKNDAHGAA